MPFDQSADVVIVGGGIVGLSTAYHLGLLQAGRVVLLERDSLLGTGSTGRCAGGFRHQFSSEINIRLSLESVRMILAFADELDYPVDIHQDGYLFLLTRTEDVRSFQANTVLQRRHGVPSQVLSPREVRSLAPHVALDGVQAAAYCPSDGIADPGGMTQGYAAAARRLGVTIRTATGATGLKIRRGRLEGVESSSGFIPCRWVVNAAGPHARAVAAWANVDLPVFPERRHVYATHPFPSAPKDYLMVIDFATTFYFHRESGGVLMGMGRPNEQPGFDLSVDPDFLPRVLEVAIRRYPTLENASIARSWVGLYEMSPDAHPILGKVPEVEGLVLANGFSGHGFQHAPVIGKLIAEEIVLGAARTLDIDPLRMDRFRGTAAPRELNVV